MQPIAPGRKEEQIHLYNDTFHTNFTREQWDAKHFHNPYTGASENFGMIDQGALVGFNMFMPQEYCVDGEPYLLAYSCESVVRADHRGQGYLRTIISEAEQAFSPRYDLVYATPNHQSRRTFEKLGYQLQYEMDSLILPGSLQRFSSEVAHRVLKIRNLSAQCDLDLLLERAFSGSGVKIAQTCPPGINWGFDGDSGRIHPCRSEVLYQWKIDSYTPVGQTRRYFWMEEGREVTLFCVVSFSLGKGAYTAHILDLYVRSNVPGHFRHLTKGLRKVCGMVRVLAPSQGQYRIMLEKTGFLVRQRAAFPLMYKIINPQAAWLEDAIHSEDSWAFRFIEVDTVFN